jgi:hypothetical protein
MTAGDVVVWPTARGNPINPYFPSVEKMRPAWVQDGWGAALIVEAGREFDFLAWYRPLTIASAMSEKPGMPEVLGKEGWALKRAGTCSASHFRKMRMEKIGTVTIDRELLDRHFPNRPSARSAAVNDISIANKLHIGPALHHESIHLPGEGPNNKWGRQHEGIRKIQEILG